MLCLKVQFELINQPHFIIIPKLEESGLDIYFRSYFILVVLIDPHGLRNVLSLLLLATHYHVVGVDVAHSAHDELAQLHLVGRCAIHNNFNYHVCLPPTHQVRPLNGKTSR